MSEEAEKIESADYPRGVGDECARWEALIENWQHAAEGYHDASRDERMPDPLRLTDAARADVYRTVISAAERVAKH